MPISYSVNTDLNQGFHKIVGTALILRVDPSSSLKINARGGYAIICGDTNHAMLEGEDEMMHDGDRIELKSVYIDWKQLFPI